MLGHGMPPLALDEDHPQHLYTADSGQRFALPLMVVRWRDLGLSFAFDTKEMGVANLLMGTAVGSPTWNFVWLLEPGATKRVRCRLNVAPWEGWEGVEARYRVWDGCLDSSFTTGRRGLIGRQRMIKRETIEIGADSGLALSRRLFEERGKPLLEQLGLLDRCAVVCLGGLRQNAGLDHRETRDRSWRPYLTFVMASGPFNEHADRLREALVAMPDEVGGVKWRGDDGEAQRPTRVCERGAFFEELTGLASRPRSDADWQAVLRKLDSAYSPLAARLSGTSHGAIFHEPDNELSMLWNYWKDFVPPVVQYTLIANALRRADEAGPERGLLAASKRRDKVGFRLVLDRFINEIVHLVFLSNETFTPDVDFRSEILGLLPIVPQGIESGLTKIMDTSFDSSILKAASEMTESLKLLLLDLYHLPCAPDASLGSFADAVRKLGSR